MPTPRDRGWGDPYELTSADMVQVNVTGRCRGLPARVVLLRNADVGLLHAELVRRLVAAGWAGPNDNTWGYAGRLKRWAENDGQQWGSAPMGSVSEHAWGTVCDYSSDRNPMLERRPADIWAHTDLPLTTERIAGGLGFAWAGTWREPFDPMHFEYEGTPDDARTAAAWLRRADSLEDPMGALSDAEQKYLVDVAELTAKVLPLVSQRLSDVERRAIVWEGRREADDQDERTRDAAELERDAASAARDAELQADVDALLQLGQSRPTGAG